MSTWARWTSSLRRYLDMAFSDQEIEEFKTEALEMLDAAEKSLLSLDGAAAFKPAFDTVFRCFHNLKGGAGVMELTALQTHTHELENILMGFQNKGVIPAEYVSLFLRGIDGARTLLEGQTIDFNFDVSVEVTKPQVAKPEVGNLEAATNNSASTAAPSSSLFGTNEEFVVECEERVERISKSLQQIENGDHSKELIDSIYRDVHSLKGVAYLFSYGNLGDLSHGIESSLEILRTGSHVPSKILINVLFKCVELIELEVTCIKAKMDNSEIKGLVGNILRMLSEATAALEPALIQAEPSQTVPQTATTAAKIPAAANHPPTAESAAELSSIRVSVPLLDNLMTLMGEMVLVRNQVIQFSNTSENMEFVNLSKRLNVVTSEIQGELMKTRMQPIGNVLGKFSRVVRDLSGELGKQIAIELQGADTELDKSLLEAIKDPLTHIVRNSCDHGIEMPETRRQAGKPIGGRITIKSYHEGGQVVIEIADDGKGLNSDLLLRKGIEKGLITEARAKTMNEKEIFNLIFAPGFSTAAKVTNVSGRGVGMDVVRTNIEKIGGTVELSSVTGTGTTIRIKIPLTLAIVPALIVNSGKNIFAIPQVKLVELVRVDQSSESKVEYLHGAPVFRLRGSILPLVDLDQLLGVAKTKEKPAVLNIAVLNAEHCSFGLIVEEVQDTADIVVKPINRLLKSLQVYSGATVLGDGSVALILDVLGLSKVAQIGKEELNADDSNGERSLKKNKTSDVQDYLLVRVNSPTKHAMVLGYVNRLEEFDTNAVELSGAQRVIRYGDTILPLISANLRLGYAATVRDVTSGKFPVVVVERAGCLYGIEVDEIIDTLSSSLEISSSLAAGGAISGNLNTKDELVVVVDPFELILQTFPHLKSVVVAGEKVVARHAPRAAGPMRILLVEDTPFFRRAIANVLLSGGYEIVTASDGQEAVEILNSDEVSFDLLVTDIEMPRMNGFELAKSVRSNPKFETLPMLAISSRADKSHVQKGVAAGFNVYLEKLQAETLLSMVSELIGPARRAA